MKTAKIIKNLLDYSNEHEWVVSQDGFIVCQECGGDKPLGHKEGCSFVETKEAAAKYLKIMNGDTV